MITKEIKQKILKALEVSRSNFAGSDSKFAVSLGISAAVQKTVNSTVSSAMHNG